MVKVNQSMILWCLDITHFIVHQV